MSNNTFKLFNQIEIVNPAANLDTRYGPWLSVNDANANIDINLREKGLTVGIYVPNNNPNSPIIEYWWKDGTNNVNLVPKADITSSLADYFSQSNIFVSNNLTVGGNVSATKILANKGSSDEWNTAYTIATSYQSVSSNYAKLDDVDTIQTLVNSATGTLIQTTTVNSLTSQLVKITDFNDYRTSVAASTATLLPITTFRNLSGLGADSTLSLTSSNTVQNSAITFVLNQLVPAPTYSQPSASITSISDVEVGTNVIQNLTLNWTQRDAGNVTGVILTRNGNQVGSYANLPQTYSLNETADFSAKTFTNTVSYQEGPLKTNSLGIPATNNRIVAGSVSSTTTLLGKYRHFYGSVTTVPQNSSQVRTTLSSGLDINSFTILADKINTVVYIPTTKILSNAITANNENLTSSFVRTTVLLNDAGNMPRSYYQYVYTTVTALGINITFTLTNA